MGAVFDICREEIVHSMEDNEEESSFSSPTDTVMNSINHVNKKREYRNLSGANQYYDPALSTDKQRAGQDRLFIAAIDIGTTYSGYAYASRRDVEKDPSNIYCPQWRSDEGLYYKTATAVLFDEDGNFNKFGFEAEEYYNDDQSDKFKCFFSKTSKCFCMRKGYLFVGTWYKVEHLISKQDDLSKTDVIKDITGKQMKAIQVFSAAISYLKDHLLKTLQKSFQTDSNISYKDIHWVLTVPAIWEMRAKQFMRDAAEMAGISGDQLSLALEPEAASLYCRKVPMRIKDSVTKTVDLLGPGISYVVLDQGEPGICPPPIIVPGQIDTICVKECNRDDDCQGEKKCCSYICGRVCSIPTGGIKPKPVKPGFCPPVPRDSSGVCVDECSSDDTCQGEKKCCSNGCGHFCSMATGGVTPASNLPNRKTTTSHILWAWSLSSKVSQGLLL
ncbi:unnamed protein product [Mytilus edulis]|uniref:WAP domain-containing protein n=1 Tax=Mytilus edulis TaxID=6550 RepID=A0A8S3SQS9_MYTED|nr:unnamed protein product [Mytilus edulis]